MGSFCSSNGRHYEVIFKPERLKNDPIVPPITTACAPRQSRQSLRCLHTQKYGHG